MTPLSQPMDGLLCLSLCHISGIEHAVAFAWRMHTDRTMMSFRTVYQLVPIPFYCHRFFQPDLDEELSGVCHPVHARPGQRLRILRSSWYFPSLKSWTHGLSYLIQVTFRSRANPSGARSLCGGAGQPAFLPRPCPPLASCSIRWTSSEIYLC